MIFWYFLLNLEALITNLVIWGRQLWDESAVFLTPPKMFPQKNNLDENQIFPIVFSKMFSKAVFHLKVSQNWF